MSISNIVLAGEAAAAIGASSEALKSSTNALFGKSAPAAPPAAEPKVGVPAPAASEPVETKAKAVIPQLNSLTLTRAIEQLTDGKTEQRNDDGVVVTDLDVLKSIRDAAKAGNFVTTKLDEKIGLLEKDGAVYKRGEGIHAQRILVDQQFDAYQAKASVLNLNQDQMQRVLDALGEGNPYASGKAVDRAEAALDPRMAYFKEVASKEADK